MSEVGQIRLAKSGLWRALRHSCEVVGDPSRLRLPYAAAEVNLVMTPGEAPASVEILDNGLALDHQSRGADIHEEPDGSTWLYIDRPRMYSLVRRDRFLTRLIELSSRAAGLHLYAFTFSTCVPKPA